MGGWGGREDERGDERGNEVWSGGEAVMYKIMSIRTNLIKASLLQMN